MIKLFFLALVFMVINANLLYSQDVAKFCFSSEINKEAYEKNPDAPLAKEFLDKFTQNFELNYSDNKHVYIIPIVFHIVHNYGAENISKEQVLDALRILNEDFRKMNEDTTLIIPEFKSIAADSRIEFRLAKIDPNGNCTDGINRIVSSQTVNANEWLKFTDAPAWPRQRYLNVWTVASIENGAAGYSYYPSMVDGGWGVDVDGVLQRSNYTGSIGTSDQMRRRTLTHEVGHYLNLMHPWGNSNSPNLPSNCFEDDEVADTPNTLGHTSCNLYAETCGSLDNVQNYMEYSYCGRMFTNGQKIRMQAALNSNVSSRNNLWSEQNLIATGTNDGYIADACLPTPDFRASNNKGCAGIAISFTDYSWGADDISEWLWEFPGGSPATSTEQNPTVVYSTQGSYDVILNVGNNNGIEQLVRNEFITVYDNEDGIDNNFIESFEEASFPSYPTFSESWIIYNQGLQGWSRVTNAASEGNASLFFNNSDNAPKTESNLFSPIILTNNIGANALLKYDLAYAKRNSESDDILRVFVSVDCGKTWKLRLARNAEGLITNGGNNSPNFVPNASQWREESISLATWSSYPSIIIRFQALSNNGGRLYLDNIRLESTTKADNNIINYPYLYPNPTSDYALMDVSEFIGQQASYEIYDIVGKLVLNNNIGIIDGNDLIISVSKLSSGVYNLIFKTHSDVKNYKIIVN